MEKKTNNRTISSLINIEGSLPITVKAFTQITALETKYFRRRRFRKTRRDRVTMGKLQMNEEKEK